MNDNERKGKEFLNYVANNIEMLKQNLRKNITYNEELFEDAFNETILKVYNSIIKNGTEVKDWKHYFFISSKWTYILNDNRDKKNKEIEVRGLFETDTFDCYEENDINERERYDKTNEAIERIKDLIIGDFTEQQAEIYLTYWMGKAMKKQTSYASIAEKFNISKRETKETITSIRDYLNENSRIMEEIKRKFKD